MLFCHLLMPNTKQKVLYRVHTVRKNQEKSVFSQCTVRNILARDQIITGVSSNEIRKHALKNQWTLDELIKNGRQLEAATEGVGAQEEFGSTVNRIKYSSKARKRNELLPVERKQPRTICNTCSSRTCPGGKKCPGTKVECFQCGKRGHIQRCTNLSEKVEETE